MSDFNGKPTDSDWRTIRTGVAGVYLHASGATVLHCGHPTANWPLYGELPDGRMIVSHNGRGFRHVADAKRAVELAIAGRRICTECFNHDASCRICGGTGDVAAEDDATSRTGSDGAA